MTNTIKQVIPEVTISIVANQQHQMLTLCLSVPATRLDVTVALVRIPEEMLKRWHDLDTALGRQYSWLAY